MPVAQETKCSRPLAQDQRTFIGRKLDRAWRETDADRALSDLRTLASQLQTDHPGAAASLREGLEETLTVSRLNLSPSLLRTLKSTDPIESMISVARTVTGNVKRWRDGTMIVRWTAAGILEAEKQFRRINGFRDLQLLHIALEAYREPIETAAVVWPSCRPHRRCPGSRAAGVLVPPRVSLFRLIRLAEGRAISPVLQGANGPRCGTKRPL